MAADDNQRGSGVQRSDSSRDDDKKKKRVCAVPECKVLSTRFTTNGGGVYWCAEHRDHCSHRGCRIYGENLLMVDDASLRLWCREHFLGEELPESDEDRDTPVAKKTGFPARERHRGAETSHLEGYTRCAYPWCKTSITHSMASGEDEVFWCEKHREHCCVKGCREYQNLTTDHNDFWCTKHFGEDETEGSAAGTNVVPAATAKTETVTTSTETVAAAAAAAPSETALDRYRRLSAHPATSKRVTAPLKSITGARETRRQQQHPSSKTTTGEIGVWRIEPETGSLGSLSDLALLQQLLSPEALLDEGGTVLLAQATNVTTENEWQLRCLNSQSPPDNVGSLKHADMPGLPGFFSTNKDVHVCEVIYGRVEGARPDRIIVKQHPAVRGRLMPWGIETTHGNMVAFKPIGLPGGVMRIISLIRAPRLTLTKHHFSLVQLEANLACIVS